MDKRFEVTMKQGLIEGTHIILDKETGVQYLMAFCGNGCGLTVLVDKDGKPLLAKGYER